MAVTEKQALKDSYMVCRDKPGCLDVADFTKSRTFRRVFEHFIDTDKQALQYFITTNCLSLHVFLSIALIHFLPLADFI